MRICLRNHLFAVLLFLSILVLPRGLLAFPGQKSSGSTDFGDHAAVARWTEQLQTAKGDQRIAAWIRRGEVYRTLGFFRNAEADFRAALEAAQSEKRETLEVVAAQSLGGTLSLLNDRHQAEALLRSALPKAKSLDRPSLSAGCSNTLAGVLINRGQRDEAELLYRDALRDALKANDPGLEAAIRRNLARALTKEEEAIAELKEARKVAGHVSSPVERTELLLGIAAEMKKRRSGADGVSFRYGLLRDAYDLSSEGGPAVSTETAYMAARLHSLAAGEMGALYEEQGRISEALDLTGQAMAAAQALRSHELLLQWERQLGGLLNKQGKQALAIASYRRAVSHIEAIRQDIPIEYQDGRSSFRETLAPVYSALADLLLRESGNEANDEKRQGLLREARDTIERIKQSELQDYFRDRCLASRSRQIETLSPTTAVLYPIILPDRLELLVDMGGRLYRNTSPATAKELESVALNLAHTLRTLSFYREPAQQIYRWLIEPVRSILEEHHVDTIVFVPDGPLRLLPIAALFDGKHHLVERYAIVTAPGLTLLDSSPLPREEMLALLSGMSEPGPVIQELPAMLRNSLRLAAAGRAARNVRGVSVVSEQLQPVGSEKSDSEGEAAAVKEMLALPGVEREIDELSHLLQGQTLMNEGFKLDRFSMELSRNPFRIVHIASHGYFGGSPEQNFIMTHDRLLNMNTLEELVKPKQFAKRPVEMITLSACQTAEGNERSPLGLTGIAVKSGARSALGTLWPVSDEAAQILMLDFYTHLADARASKAETLRRAQLKLMSHEGFQHPFYWSPFILVGNWL